MVDYPLWKLDIIATDLQGISYDSVIVHYLELVKRLYSSNSLSVKEIIKLADLYGYEFDHNEVYVTGGYTQKAIKERFDTGREELKRTIWDRYVITREDSILEAIKWRIKNNKQVPEGAQCVLCFYNRPMTAWGETFVACWYRSDTGKELYGGTSCSGYMEKVS